MTSRTPEVDGAGAIGMAADARLQQRQWFNRMCDAEARRHMLAERTRLDAEVGPVEEAGE